MKRPPHPCRVFGCKQLITAGLYCEIHKKEKYKKQSTVTSLEVKRRYDKTRPTARERGYDTRWDKFRAYYLRRHPICIKCGAQATLIHHIEPLPDGDKYDDCNLQSLCAACHNRIHHRV
jgi:5-methylcytosine-specific restriction protein A